MEFRVLGRLAVFDTSGTEVVLKGTRLRSLLALLVLHPGEVVPADRLVEELWGHDQPVDAAAALQTQVSRLRAALRPAGLDGHVVTRPPGYVLDVDPAVVDADRFQEAAQEGRAHLEAGDPARAAELLGVALRLWQGEVAADLVDEELAQGKRAHLLELRRLAEEDRVDAELALGRHREVVPELERLVAGEPLRERRTAQLVLALYRCGRQAEALRAYQATREVLAEELGIEPGPELRRLEAAVLAQDSALDAAPAPAPAQAQAPVAARTPVARPVHRVPEPLSRLVGRGAELTRLEELLRDHRLVTVLGPGGAGKTRLAIEAARVATPSFAAGAALVELAPIEESSAVVGAIARALDAEEPRDPASAHLQLAELVGDRHMLLVLDNAEHVLDEVARVATTLLGHCPSLSAFVTSREGLGLPGEATLVVGPLERTSSVQLFTERARAVLPSFQLDGGTRSVVDEMCGRLDDLPLAIELAASRLRVLAPAQLAERLDDRFRVLTGGSRVALPRQQTLRAVVDWSYELLDQSEQRVFERLSVFAGGCALDAAEEVCGFAPVAAADVAGILDRLVDKSLVVATPTEDGHRFTMLQTLHQYAREHLASGSDEETTRQRLAAWLLRQAIHGEETLGETRSSFALRFGRELDNVRAGLAWAVEHDPALAVEIAARLVWFWFFNDAQVDGFRALSQGLAREPELDDQVRARALVWASLLAGTLGQAELSERWGEAAIAMARATGEARLIGRIACLRGERLVDQGRLDEAAELFAESRRNLEQADESFSLAYLDVREGFLFTYQGKAAEAYWSSHRALRAFRAIGDDGLLILALQRVGETAGVCGYFDEAATALEEAIARNEGLPGFGRRSQLVSRLARVRVDQGDPAAGLALAEEAVALAGNQTWDLVTGMALQARGRALGALGRVDEAVTDLESAVERMTSVGVAAMADSVRAELADLRALARR